jgi:hypothetical protein
MPSYGPVGWNAYEPGPNPYKLRSDDEIVVNPKKSAAASGPDVRSVHPNSPRPGDVKPVNPNSPRPGDVKPVNPNSPRPGHVKPVNPNSPRPGHVQR